MEEQEHQTSRSFASKEADKRRYRPALEAFLMASTSSSSNAQMRLTRRHKNLSKSSKAAKKQNLLFDVLVRIDGSVLTNTHRCHVQRVLHAERLVSLILCAQLCMPDDAFDGVLGTCLNSAILLYVGIESVTYRADSADMACEVTESRDFSVPRTSSMSITRRVERTFGVHQSKLDCPGPPTACSDYAASLAVRKCTLS